MLKGYDVSNWQENTPLDLDFVIAKSSEGNGWKDPLFDFHVENALKKGKLIGAYHYARPDLGNKPCEEAIYFYEQIKKYLGKILVALDWEGQSLDYSVDWCLGFLETFYQKSGVRPLLYIQKSEEMKEKYRKISEKNYGLWLAHWGVAEPKPSNFDFIALWQYRGSPLDKNIFYGDKNAWLKYANSKNKDIELNDKVMVTSRYDYNGVKCDEWVLYSQFDVMEIKGDRIVLTKNGTVIGAWKKENIVKI